MKSSHLRFGTTVVRSAEHVVIASSFRLPARVVDLICSVLRLFALWVAIGMLSAVGVAQSVIDLTHPFDEHTIYWPTETGFVLNKGDAGITERGYFYAANRFAAPEHGGTHIDAPFHFAERGQTVEHVSPS